MTTILARAIELSIKSHKYFKAARDHVVQIFHRKCLSSSQYITGTSCWRLAGYPGIHAPTYCCRSYEHHKRDQLTAISENPRMDSIHRKVGQNNRRTPMPSGYLEIG